MDLPTLANQFRSFLSVNSVGSVALAALIWFVVSIVIIASTDTGGNKYADKDIKANLGLLFLFLIVGSGLMYLLFSFAPAA